MYIKKVTTRNGKTKKLYSYLHLVENVRTPAGPRQRLILSLGKLEVHPSQYKALAQRIEDILTGQKSFVEVDSKIEKYAQTISKKLFHKRAQEEEEKRPPDYQSVDTSSVQISAPCTLGPEYVCHSVWKELGLPDFFREQGLSERVQPLIEALVVGRMIDSGSERYTKEWAEKRSALYELCGFPVRNSLNSYYRAGDHLYSVKEALESHLAVTEKNLFSLSEKMVLLDLTNTFFEGRAEGNPKAKRGHSKEKRSDCKLVTLGLLLDENGFAKYSQLFPGNQSEPTAMRQMITALEKQIGPHQKDRTVVMDQGISTKENIQWLKERGYHYITVHRGGRPEELDYDDFEVIKEDSSKGVKIEVKRFPKEDELFVLCRSAQKTVTEKGIRKRVEDLFIERLTHYKEGLALRGRMKKYGLILQKIGRLKEKYPRASSLYDVEVVPESGKKAEDASLLAMDIIWKKKKEKYPDEIQAEGTYLLKTDRLDLEDKEIWETYRMLNHVESSFRSLKSHLGLRPNFHQVEQRVDAHLFISVVAYHLLHAVEYRLKALGERRCWKTICNVLKTHERMTLSYSYRDAQGQNKKQFVRLSSTVEAEHRKIYGLLNLSGVALPRKKMNQLRE